MKYVLSVSEMRAFDRAALEAGDTEAGLIWKAAGGLEEVCRPFDSLSAVCGPGNNGGDGLALLVRRLRQGKRDTAVVLGDRFSAGLSHYLDLFEREGGRVLRTLPAVLEGEAVVDALFGVGLTRVPEGVFAEAVRKINQFPGPVIACDLPSGLNGDTGAPFDPCVRADRTVSMAAFKIGQMSPEGRTHCGRLVAVDAGIPTSGKQMVLEAEDVAGLFPPRDPLLHKGSAGTVTLIEGCAPYFGAALIASLASAALLEGAGLCRLAVPESLLPIYQQRVTETVLYPLSEARPGHLGFRESELEKLLSSRVIVMGMGLGDSDEVYEAADYLLAHYRGVLALDADALNAVARRDRRRFERAHGPLCLLPHPGEFSRLTGKAGTEFSDEEAREYAARNRLCLLLKGHTTRITDGSRMIYNLTGGPALAKAGSGDALAGFAGGLLTRGEPLTALAAAAYLHGLCGDLAAQQLGEYSVLASDLPRFLPAAIGRITGRPNAGNER